MPDLVASMTQTAVDYHEKLTREKRPIWREAAAVKP